MDEQLTFNFKKDISHVIVPSKLNNPFDVNIPDIACTAAKEFQEFIAEESKKWEYDFRIQQGKMFGILVIQKEDYSFGYLGTVSGKLPQNAVCPRFVPSVFDDSAHDFFMNKGMTELSEIGNQIKKISDPDEINSLKKSSKQKSIALQQRLFENYHFSNISGKTKNLLEIFAHSSQGKPPSAAGECVAPKLLQYAIQHRLKPVALAEFWWGNPMKNNEREHSNFYPACKNRCRPILEYMLNDNQLYKLSLAGSKKN